MHWKSNIMSGVVISVAIGWLLYSGHVSFHQVDEAGEKSFTGSVVSDGIIKGWRDGKPVWEFQAETVTKKESKVFCEGISQGKIRRDGKIPIQFKAAYVEYDESSGKVTFPEHSRWIFDAEEVLITRAVWDERRRILNGEAVHISRKEEFSASADHFQYEADTEKVIWNNNVHVMKYQGKNRDLIVSAKSATSSETLNVWNLCGPIRIDWKNEKGSHYIEADEASFDAAREAVWSTGKIVIGGDQFAGTAAGAVSEAMMLKLTSPRLRNGDGMLIQANLIKFAEERVVAEGNVHVKRNNGDQIFAATGQFMDNDSDFTEVAAVLFRVQSSRLEATHVSISNGQNFTANGKVLMERSGHILTCMNLGYSAEKGYHYANGGAGGILLSDDKGNAISAKTLRIMDSDGEYRFEGPVRVAQKTGNIIRAENAIYDASKRKITLWGSLEVNKTDGRSIHAEKVDILLDKDTAEFSGNVEVLR